MKVARKYFLAVSILIFLLISKNAKAFQPIETFITDNEFYSQNFNLIRPSEKDMEEFTFPSWLTTQKSQLGIKFDYEGIISVRLGRWKNTRIYDYSTDLWYIAKLPNYSILDSQTLGISLINEYFRDKVNYEDTNNITLDINGQEELFSPRIAYAFSIFKYLRGGLSINYYTYGENLTYLSDNLNADLAIDIIKEHERTIVGWYRSVDDFGSNLSTLISLPSLSNLNLKWYMKNINVLNGIYLMKSFDINNYEFMAKCFDSPVIFNSYGRSDFRLETTTNNRYLGLGFLYEDRKEVEEGPVSLISIPEKITKSLPNFVNQSSAKTNLDINYQDIETGWKIWGNINQYNKIFLTYLRRTFNIDSDGNTQISNNTSFISLTPFYFSQNLRIIVDEVGGNYVYNDSSWKIDLSLRHISIYNTGGNIYYWDIVNTDNNSLIQFDDLRMINFGINVEKKIGRLSIQVGIDQYVPLPQPSQSSQSTTTQAQSTPPPTSQNETNTSSSNNQNVSNLKKSSPTNNYWYEYLFNSGFGAEVKIIYYF